MDTPVPPHAATVERLIQQVLEPMKQTFVGKDEIIDLLGVCLAAGENLFLLGPPGTAKSALVQELARRIDGHMFDYLLTRFTEPNELFGPFDIRRLREGDLVTNTEGMLPEAELIFLDELLNANSAILNSLLMVLNERVFRRGRESRRLPMLLVVGASNRLPEDEALKALFDRFLLRVTCDNVPQEQLGNMLQAGWKLEQRAEPAATVSAEDIRTLQQATAAVSLADILSGYVELIHRLRHAGIDISDRRAVRLQRLVAASALLSGRSEANLSDCWVLRYVWERQEQQEILTGLVQTVVDGVPADAGPRHPRSRPHDRPDAESLARDLDRIEQALAALAASADTAADAASSGGATSDGESPPAGSPPRSADVERSCLRDQLALLSGRVEWVEEEQHRTHLATRIESLWRQVDQPAGHNPAAASESHDAPSTAPAG